jgi:ABC-type branched-subunit amino acid transport system substrate-binding protein
MEGMTAADHLFKRRLVRRLMIYSDGSLYTRGAESEFRQHFQLKQNGRIADTVHLRTPGWEQRSSDLLHAHNPEAVYIIGHAERILEVLRHLHQAGFDGIRCTTSTFFVNNVIRQAGELAEGVVFPLSSYDIATGSKELQTFAEMYQERHGHKPDIFAAHGYDAMKVTIRTLNNAESFYPSGLRNAMAFKLDNLTGATGALAFDDYGDVRRYPVMHIYHKGEVISWSAYRDGILASLPKL